MHFQPTQEEIKKASEGSKVPFKDKEEYSFMFQDIKEKAEEDKMIIETVIVGGEFDGRKHSFWFRTNNEYDRATMLSITDNYLTREELGKQGFNFGTTIGTQFKSTAKIGKTGYTNFYSFAMLDSAPDVSISADDIPF